MGKFYTRNLIINDDLKSVSETLHLETLDLIIQVWHNKRRALRYYISWLNSFIITIIIYLASKHTQ